MRLRGWVAVEWGIEVFESFRLFGRERRGVDEDEACEAGVKEGEDFWGWEAWGGAKLVGSCYGCTAKVRGCNKSGERSYGWELMGGAESSGEILILHMSTRYLS